MIVARKPANKSVECSSFNAMRITLRDTVVERRNIRTETLTKAILLQLSGKTGMNPTANDVARYCRANGPLGCNRETEDRLNLGVVRRITCTYEINLVRSRTFSSAV